MTGFTKYATDFLISETQSLLTRLDQMKSFEMTIPMVRSASVSDDALKLIGRLLEKGKADLRKSIHAFIRFLNFDHGNEVSEEQLQNRYSALKLRYNQILDQLDIFADVLSQRCEHETGVWLSGLDVLAENGLKVGKAYYKAPPLMVYLDRGHGAAIRRARTRLPGGDENPVAVIQIPRERMVGHGIASSLLHEVGHQGASLLDLIPAVRPAIDQAKMAAGKYRDAWTFFGKWISEILSDYWALAHLGVCATMGLMGVVSLPSYFQFRLDYEDPHPAPYIRVQISCRTGKRLFPDAQWDRLWNLWSSFYPKEKQSAPKLNVFSQLEHEMDCFIDLIINHKPPSLEGRRLIDLFDIHLKQPELLRNTFQTWRIHPELIDSAEPISVFGVLGQAKADRRISSKEESYLLKRQLNRWANNR